MDFHFNTKLVSTVGVEIIYFYVNRGVVSKVNVVADCVRSILPTLSHNKTYFRTSATVPLLDHTANLHIHMAYKDNVLRKFLLLFIDERLTTMVADGKRRCDLGIGCYAFA